MEGRVDNNCEGLEILKSTVNERGSANKLMWVEKNENLVIETPTIKGGKVLMYFELK